MPASIVDPPSKSSHLNRNRGDPLRITIQMPHPSSPSPHHQHPRMKPSLLPKINCFTSPSQSPTRPTFSSSSAGSTDLKNVGPPPRPPQAVNIIPPTPVVDTGPGAAGPSGRSAEGRRSPLKAWVAGEEEEQEQKIGGTQNVEEVETASSPEESFSPVEETQTSADVPPPRPSLSSSSSKNRRSPPHREDTTITHEEVSSPTEEPEDMEILADSPTKPVPSRAQSDDRNPLRAISTDVLSTSPSDGAPGTSFASMELDDPAPPSTHPSTQSPSASADSAGGKTPTPATRDSGDTITSPPNKNKQNTLELPAQRSAPMREDTLDSMSGSEGSVVGFGGFGNETAKMGKEQRHQHGGHVHRRSSSTHRVLETLDAQHSQSSTGERMVNQYSLGPNLGRGAYGIVEKGIDVSTGTEYAIKEFSKARLKRQIEQTQARSKGRRGRARGGLLPPGEGGADGEHPGKEAEDRDAVAAEDKEEADKKGNDPAKVDPLMLIRREVAVMKKLDHPNIVLLYEAIDVPSSDCLYLVLEYMPGGTLIDVKVDGPPAKAYDPEMARDYFRQLLLGLEYLHENDVAHRDIKPDNILLSADRKTVKLCDFGVSEMFTAGDDRIKTSTGSPAFMSPEAAMSHQQDIHARPTDIWALGVTLYCMLQGKLPFATSNPLEMYDAIKSAHVEIDPQWGDDLKDLMPKILKKDPMRRITVPEMKEHPWVTNNGEDPMPSTEENLYCIGQQVEEPSEEEITKAIGSIRTFISVLRAVQKMRRGFHRRSASNTAEGVKSAPATSSTFSIRPPDSPSSENGEKSPAPSASAQAPTDPAPETPLKVTGKARDASIDTKIEVDRDEVSSPGSIDESSDHFNQSFNGKGKGGASAEPSPPPSSPGGDGPGSHAALSAKRKWKERITSRVNSVDEAESPEGKRQASG